MDVLESGIQEFKMLLTSTISTAPAWARMWTLAALIYFVLKLMTWCVRKPQRVAVWKHLAYLLAWPGMNPDRFLGSRRCDVSQPAPQEWLFALFKFGLGLALLRTAIMLLPSFTSYFV